MLLHVYLLSWTWSNYFIDTPEGQRRLSLEDNDPAYTVSLKDFILQLLNQASSVGLNPYWEKADAGTKRSLEKFLN